MLQLPKSRVRVGKTSMREPVERSASVELCETDGCFLHIQLNGTNVRLPKTHNVPPEKDFESSRSPAKSESCKSPSLHCCALFSHDNLACIHVCDEYVRSNAPSVVYSLLTSCSKCLYLARTGRRDISWSVNKLARASTEWTEAHDKRSGHIPFLLFLMERNSQSLSPEERAPLTRDLRHLTELCSDRPNRQ